MKRCIAYLLIGLASSLPSLAQQPWVLLQEYNSPHYWAQGLYYDGKFLWHVDSDSGSGENTIYIMNPYNLDVIDSIPSPVDQAWGITCTKHNFWLTSGHWGDPEPELVRIRPDTFAVDTSIGFQGYYFYGITWDSVGGNLWVATQTEGYDQYILEFNPDSCEVVQWHPWPSNWSLGIQYWDSLLWTNTQDWYYPDFTMIMDINTWQMSNSLTAPNLGPEGIATNGVIWWLSYLRQDYHCIQKVIPPGVGVHDIAAYSSPLEDSTELHVLFFQPTAEFINYGSIPEYQVPFVLRVKEMPSGVEIYYDSLIYEPEIEPEEIVEIIYNWIVLEPDAEYKFIFYSNLQTDQYRNNDTLKVTLSTAAITVIHDLAIIEVLEPDSLEQQATIYPVIRVSNTGTEFEPIAPVHLDIAHPNGSHTTMTATAVNLSPGETDTLEFSAFSPPDIGTYVFTFDGQLPLDMYPGNDFRQVTCVVGMVHDVAPVAILSPQTYEPVAPITPRALVENLGNFSENAFYTDCSVSDSSGQVYWQHVICPPLDPSEQQELPFPNFVPPYPALYTFTFTTQLGIDNLPENDTLSVNCGVGLIWDVAPTLVLEPSSILSTDPFSPKMVVTNLGNIAATGFYTYCWADTDSVAVYASQRLVPSLEPGQEDTVVFETLSLTQPNNYRFRFITNWLLDNNPENDTLIFMAELPVDVAREGSQTVHDFRVEGGFPNPFNAQSSLVVYLPLQAQVGIDLFNLSGQKMRHLDFGRFPSGAHQLAIHAAGLPSGVFLAVVRAGAWQKTLKLVLLK